MIRRYSLLLITVSWLSSVSPALPDDAQDTLRLEQEFRTTVLPIVNRFCSDCHGKDHADAQLNLSQDTSPEDVIRRHETWMLIRQRIMNNEMPPKDASPQPSQQERDQVSKWIQELTSLEARRRDGDPGYVPARRLSNAEFNNSIRDLTGQDLQPASQFPVDPANAAGFDNSGESLSMSPALLQKYLEAARFVADHVLLTPDRLLFAPHPVVTETDRDKFCVQRIVDFYRRHEVDYSKYIRALWQYSNREALGHADWTLESLAQSNHLSSRYLATLQTAFQRTDARGPFHELTEAWKKLPSPQASDSDLVAAIDGLARLIREIRADLEDPIPRLQVEGMSRGSQPLILWWNRQVAKNRMSFAGDGDDAELDALRGEFCQVFPSAFSVSSRGHYSDANLGKDVRLLSAGFHLMQGYFRDDLPMQKLLLTESEQKELDDLWRDLNFSTHAPYRQYRDFLFFERAEPPQFAGGPEFDFARPENRNVTEPVVLEKMHTLFASRAKDKGASEDAMAAVHEYFREMNSEFRRIEAAESSCQELHLGELLRFAARAWRRRLTMEEEKRLRDFYAQLRTELSHEDAVRDCLASILVSPRFCYRADLGLPTRDPNSTAEVSEVRPLDDFELASRLSYFLWASMPDETLISLAEQGTLHQPEQLNAQIERMLEDDRSRGLATEFLGNWLEFRRFQEHNSVDRTRFPQFTNDLRDAMFEEPVRYFHDMLRRNASIDELINGRHTFVNPILAKHYGLSASQDTQSQNEWIRIDDATAEGRGGLLPMAVFMTRSSPGLRTSPVKRGYWVVRRLLGEHIPAPPPTVPELPKDETQFGDLTLAQLLAKHRENVACAGCHDRFDAVGLVFEGYGSVGERRSQDLNGHDVVTTAVFPDGSSRDGLDGLREYLLQDRRSELERTFLRQLLTFALGRSLLISDEPLLDRCQQKFREGDSTIQTVVTQIVLSRQFLNRRVR